MATFSVVAHKLLSSRVHLQHGAQLDRITLHLDPVSRQQLVHALNQTFPHLGTISYLLRVRETERLSQPGTRRSPHYTTPWNHAQP